MPASFLRRLKQACGMDRGEGPLLTAEETARLKRALNLPSTPNPAKVFSLVPDTPLREPMEPVSAYLDTPVDSTNFDGITRPVEREACAARDTRPLPALEDREYYHPNRPYDYWLSGLRDYLRIRQELEAAGSPLAPDAAVFDFGCASGRVLRHFLAQDENPYRLVCADMNANHVNWVSRHLDPGVESFQSSALPHLPLEDNTFDLVYAFSVFTHIDAYEAAWLMELRRILKPGGLAYLTFQSDRTWQTLHEGHFLYQHLKNNEALLPGETITPERFAAPMPEPKVVFRFIDTNVYNTVVFQSNDYIREHWGRLFDSLTIIPEGHEFQDVALCRKRPSGGAG